MSFLSSIARLVLLHVRAAASAQYGKRQGIPGMEFQRFGRQMGLRLLAKGMRVGHGYVLAPVNITRYFEFAFVLACLPEKPHRCLDVSSPRLFSLFTASKPSPPEIRMINPDPLDISTTSRIAARLGLRRIETKCGAVDMLPLECGSFDAVYSISVLEHIYGNYDDRHAIKVLYDSLRGGGRLVVTVPVDRAFRDDYRGRGYYGTKQRADGLYFFQRVYDRNAINKRLLAPIGVQPIVTRWFGETCPGTFAEYERRWIRDGYECIVDDPREVADHYREYGSWEQMPGMGICGFMIEKPRRET